MYSIEFLKYSSPDEIRLIKALHYLLSKDIVWDILKAFIGDDALTQSEICKKIGSTNISNDINCMVDIGLLVVDYDNPKNHCCREKVYYINDDKLKASVDSCVMNFKNQFNDPTIADRIIKRCRKK